MRLFSELVTVGTTTTPILVFKPCELHSVIVEADCSGSEMDLGIGGLAAGHGLKLVDGGTLSMGYRDFDKTKEGYNDVITVYAVGGAAGDNVRVFGWRD